MARKFNQVFSVIPFILLFVNPFSRIRQVVRVDGQIVFYASPPPPSVCPYPCLPPPTVTTNCPPPPPSVAPPTVSPPTPSSPIFYPPPGGYLPFSPPPPDNINFYAPPPPDPILPYYPFYYKNPPPPFDFASAAALNPPMAWIIGIVIFLFSLFLPNITSI